MPSSAMMATEANARLVMLGSCNARKLRHASAALVQNMSRILAAPYIAKFPSAKAPDIRSWPTRECSYPAPHESGDCGAAAVGECRQSCNGVVSESHHIAPFCKPVIQSLTDAAIRLEILFPSIIFWSA